MTQLMMLIHWLGPYTRDDVMDCEWGNGLYIFTGKCRYELIKAIQYIGITEHLYRVRFANHRKLFAITRNLSIWLGQIVSPQRFDRRHLEAAESLLIYFWRSGLNEKKRGILPHPTTLISHWFTPDGKPRVNRRAIYQNLDDVLCWDGERWRTGNLRTYDDNWI